MITYLNDIINMYDHIINFIAYLIIFIGAFYVAIYNKRMPLWHVTPLWYVGLFAVFNCIIIICQFFLGTEFPLSYDTLGQMSNVLFNISVSAITIIMMVASKK